MLLIPPFNSDGLLPPGDYEVTFDQLRKSPLVLGTTSRKFSSTWNAQWRHHLVSNLEILTRQLWRIGISDVFADGSFAEAKDHPNDIDGYFTCDLDRLKSGQLARELNTLDRSNIWSWDPRSRRPYQGYPKRQLPMWHKYRVELYPHVSNLAAVSGIRDQHGNELEFPSAFRQSRSNGAPRGIIKLRKDSSHDSN